MKITYILKGGSIFFILIIFVIISKDINAQFTNIENPYYFEFNENLTDKHIYERFSPIENEAIIYNELGKKFMLKKSDIIQVRRILNGDWKNENGPWIEFFTDSIKESHSSTYYVSFSKMKSVEIAEKEKDDIRNIKNKIEAEEYNRSLFLKIFLFFTLLLLLIFVIPLLAKNWLKVKTCLIKSFINSDYVFEEKKQKSETQKLIDYKIIHYPYWRDYLSFLLVFMSIMIYYYFGIQNAKIVFEFILIILIIRILITIINRHFYNGLIFVLKEIVKKNDLKNSESSIVNNANSIFYYRLDSYRIYWNRKEEYSRIDEPYSLSLKELTISTVASLADEFKVSLNYFNYFERIFINRIKSRGDYFYSYKEQMIEKRYSRAIKESQRSGKSVDDIFSKQYDDYDLEIENKKIEKIEENLKTQKRGFQQLFGKCPFCYKKINAFATKCPHCTADL